MATREIVNEAIALGLIRADEAARYLDAPPHPKLVIVPKSAPPPERLAVVGFNGRIRKGRQRLTRALIAAGVVDGEAVRGKIWQTPKPGAEQEDTA